jgi:prolipoprotein diacylglyceryltransferase
MVSTVTYMCGRRMGMRGFSDFTAAIVIAFFGSVLASLHGGLCYQGDLIAGTSGLFLFFRARGD